MSIHGFGLGASVVGGFSDAHKSAIKAGFPDTIDTYGLVSGLWTSVFAFGAFVGEKASHTEVGLFLAIFTSRSNFWRDLVRRGHLPVGNLPGDCHSCHKISDPHPHPSLGDHR